MTTNEPLGGGSQDLPPHTAPAAPTYETEPTASAAPAPVYQPIAPKKPVGLALAALLVGIGAFLVGLVSVFGAIVGIAGVVLGVLALRKQQSKGMAITGIVLGGIAVLSSIGMTAGIGAVISNSSPSDPPAVVAPSSETAPVEEEAEPVAEEEVEPEEEAPDVPAEYASALVQAGSYSEIMSMSKVGIFDQLTSEYGGQFSKEAAQYAIDNIDADWNANALAKAKSYQETMAMSPAAIHDQLISQYGEKFTKAEADYAIKHLND